MGRVTAEDGSQRMLNVLEAGTKVAIYRHLKTSKTAICIEGCLDRKINEELPNVDARGPIHDGETVNGSLLTLQGSETSGTCAEVWIKEVAKVMICPREGKYGIHVPKGA